MGKQYFVFLTNDTGTTEYSHAKGQIWTPILSYTKTTPNGQKI